MTPADAERMARWIGIHLMSLGRAEVVSSLEQTSAERHDFRVGAGRVVDMQVEMDLLRIPVWPLRWNVIRRKLDADTPLSFGIHNAVPAIFIVGIDAPTEHAGPEGAFGGQVGRIEHDDLSGDFHLPSIVSVNVRR